MDFGNYALVMDIIISMQHLKSCECVVVNTSVMKTSSIGDLYTEISSSFLITCELSRSTFISQRAKNLAWQVVTWRPSKLPKLEGGQLCRDGSLPRTIQYLYVCAFI